MGRNEDVLNERCNHSPSYWPGLTTEPLSEAIKREFRYKTETHWKGEVGDTDLGFMDRTDV